MRVLLLGAQAALLPQRLRHGGMGLAHSHPLEPLPRLRGHQAVLIDDGDLLEAMRAADLEVGGIVARCDLERPGAELGIDMLVRDHR